MVLKIKKKFKKGPKAPHAVPLAVAMTALFGLERRGRDLRHPFEAPQKVRSALRLHLNEDLLCADRILSAQEYLEWGLRNSPARLVEMFSRQGLIPMGPPADEEDLGDDPRLGILPLVAVVRGQALESLSGRLGLEWPEVASVAFQNSIQPSLNLIPGYDLLLFRPPHHARNLNSAVRVLNQSLQDAFSRAGRSYPGDLDLLPEALLREIPLQEPCSR